MMTEQRAIDLLKGILPKKVSFAQMICASNCYGDEMVYQEPEPYAIEFAINSIQENAKLKGELKAEREWRTKTREELLDRSKEIESVKEDLKNEREWISRFMKRETKLTEENTKLKAEIKRLNLKLERG